MRDGILSAVGSTPIVRLSRYLNGTNIRLYAKMEMLNPGGSIKDRPAAKIIEEALCAGIISPGSVVVESSSGNMGIGLAQACRYHGLRFICVVDSKTTRQNIQLLRTYGAEVDIVTQPEPATGELLLARINRVKALLLEIEGSFWPNQYENMNNPASHYQATMHEITTALDGKIDVLFVATSTCGTVRGCAEYARDHGLGTRIVAVDALGSLIFSDKKANRSIPGLGAGMRPPLCELSLVDECVHVDDLDCVVGCRRLVAREAILAGGSSGGVMAAVEKVASGLAPGAACVAILPDRGERYLDTVYSDEWVRNAWGDVEYLWKEERGEVACVAMAS
jgi:2,3-diaminopropionate biosynthesis protein SbnA